jgi:hypothetical protein
MMQRGQIRWGARPAFSEWRPGDRGWGWRRNWVHDPKGHVLLFDSSKNCAALVRLQQNSFQWENWGVEGVTIVGSVASWRIELVPDTLWLGDSDGTLRQVLLKSNTVSEIERRLPHPQGSYPGNLLDLVHEQTSAETWPD